MAYLLLTLCAVLSAVSALLAWKILLMRRSAEEIRRGLQERLETDTNTLLSISSQDRAMRRLAAGLNSQLRLLRQERCRYRQGDQALKDAVANISHDLRTPLTAICGYLDLLEGEETSPDAARYLDLIRDRTDHLRQLTEEFFQYAVALSSRSGGSPEAVSLGPALEESLAAWYPVLSARGIAPEIRLPEGPVVRQLDRAALGRVLGNILSNAVKYTPEGGHVSLTVQELPQFAKQLAHYRFVVSDNGYGMSESYQKSIFQDFTREEDSVTNKIQGTGLGMAITKNLLDLMGGSIAVDSRKGRGSTFTVELELPISGQAIDQSFWQKNGVTRILAVDDEEAVCQSIRMAMEGTGVAVDCAPDGRTALDMVLRSRQEGRLYHIAVLDWKMPGMDGVETAREIRRTVGADAPLIILSGCDWPEIEEEAREAGVDAFLSKPFFLTSFRQKVETWITACLAALSGMLP